MQERPDERAAPQAPLPEAGGWPLPEAGSVWLVGAGPGDPGLLTVHALHALRAADVVIHDALVDARILSFADPAAEIVHAGKRGGCPSAAQADITARMIAEARAGRRVVRLKGGDPFVFGRGGEEAADLVRAGVALRVVPGITAGIGGLAGAGIPVTHRDSNPAVAFVTGHDRNGALPGAVDWQALSRAAPVLVCYMAMRTLPRIAEALLAAGRPADEPVAVVSDATRPTQRVLRTTLGAAAEAVAEAGLGPPAIVCIGPVVDLGALCEGPAATLAAAAP